MKAKQEEDLAAEKARLLAEKKARQAPDKDKLLEFADRIIGLDVPHIKNPECDRILSYSCDLLSKAVAFIILEVGKL